MCSIVRNCYSMKRHERICGAYLREPGNSAWLGSVTCMNTYEHISSVQIPMRTSARVLLPIFHAENMSSVLNRKAVLPTLKRNAFRGAAKFNELDYFFVNSSQEPRPPLAPGPFSPAT